MAHKIDYQLASSKAIVGDIGRQVADLRLARNISQKDSALQAGVSRRTIQRLESGETTSLDGFVRVLKALSIQQNLLVLIPDASIRPLDLADLQHKRQRARAKQQKAPAKYWQWGIDVDDDES